MQKKLLLIPLIALSILSPAHAASPSPSPSPVGSPASINEVTENLKKRLQDSLDGEPSMPSPAALAYIGVVKDIIKDTVIMEDKDGKKDIKLAGSTDILRSPGNAVIKADSIRLGDYIIAIGYPGDNDDLNGRRLIVSADPIKSPAKSSGLGTVAKLGKTSFTMTQGDKEQVVDFTAKTIFKSAAGSIEYSDLSVGDTLIYTATVDVEDDLTATHVMRIKTASVAQ